MFQYDKWIFITAMLLTHDNLGTTRYSPPQNCCLASSCLSAEGNIPKHSNLNPSTQKWLKSMLLISDHFLNLSRSYHLCVQQEYYFNTGKWKHQTVRDPGQTPWCEHSSLEHTQVLSFSRCCEGKRPSTLRSILELFPPPYRLLVP